MPKRPQKRRRISRSSTTTSDTDSTCLSSTIDSDVAPLPKHSGNLSCNSCYRSFAFSSGKESRGSLITCPMCVYCFLTITRSADSQNSCQSVSCSICARTCSTMPPSMPPTPALSYSPSPPESPSSESHTLSLDPERTPRARTRTQGALTHNEAARRRKRIDDEEDEATVIGDDDALHDKAMLSGCGRRVCKSCCIENLQRCVLHEESN